MPADQEPPYFTQEDQKQRAPDMTKEKVEERREKARERKRQQDECSKVSKANAQLLVKNNARYVSDTAQCSRTAFTRELSKQHGRRMPKYERKYESNKNSLNEARDRSRSQSWQAQQTKEYSDRSYHGGRNMQRQKVE